MSSESEPKRDLDGRCGTCGFYMKLRTDDEGVGWGDCRLGCWPSPLRDSATWTSVTDGMAASW